MRRAETGRAVAGRGDEGSSANRAWALLVGSAVLEAVWATALGSGVGPARPVATLVFLVALAASMLGLGRTMRAIPISTAYAVWTGLGAALTVIWAMATGAQPLHWGQVALIAGLVACALGLKLVDGRPSGRGAVTAGSAGAAE